MGKLSLVKALDPRRGALQQLPDDCTAIIFSFLQPGEFYSVKRAGMNVHDRLYWDNRPGTNLVQLAINHDCASLFRYSVIECDMRVSHPDVIRMLAKNRLRRYQKYIYRYSIMLYNNVALINSCILCKNNRALLDELVHDRSWQPTRNDCRYLLNPQSVQVQWEKLGTRYDTYASFVRLWSTGMYDTGMCVQLCIECNMIEEFQYMLRRNVGVSYEALDNMYDHQRWRMVALVFRYLPKLVVDYLFGDYRNPTDPYMIQETHAIIQYMRPRERTAFVTVLEKYHDWMWRFLLHRSNTLGTIDAIVRLELFSFNPNQYLELAMSSRHNVYLEYLMTRGATITMQDVYQAAKYNHRYSAMLYNHLVTCNRNEILIVITFITIVMVALLLKIERYNRTVRQIRMPKAIYIVG